MSAATLEGERYRIQGINAKKLGGKGPGKPVQDLFAREQRQCAGSPQGASKAKGILLIA